MCNRVGQVVLDAFVESMGSSLCRDIIGYVPGEAGADFRPSNARLTQQKCRNAVEVAVRATIQAAKDAGLAP